MKAAHPPWDKKRRASAAFEGMLCEFPGESLGQDPEVELVCNRAEYEGFEWVVLLRQLMVAMSLGWESGAPPTSPCNGRGTVRSEGFLKRRTKNSVSGSCVEASVVETLCGAATMGASLG